MNIFNRDKVLKKFETNYGNYEVVEMVYEGRKARVLFSGHRGAAFSGIPLDDDSSMLFDYMRRLHELALFLKPKEILDIGGGACTLATEISKTFKRTRVDVVEIDSKLTDVAQEYFGLSIDKNLNVIHQAGEKYINETKKTYDLIIVDAFEGLSIPGALSPKSVAKNIHEKLSSSGVFAMNVISAYKGSAAAPLYSQAQYLKSVFGNYKIYPAERSLPGWTSQNLILLCDKGSPRSSHGMISSEVDISDT